MYQYLAFLIVLCFQCVKSQNQSSWPSEIPIGLITSYYHSMLYDLATNETLKDIKSAGIVPKDFNYRLYQMFGCDDKSSVDSAFQILFKYNVSVLIGPECSRGMTPVALMAASLNKPIFGYLSATNDLANKTKYTTLSRISYTMTYLSKAIATTILYHKWSRVAIVRTAQINCNIFLSGIPLEFAANDIDIIHDLTIDFLSKDSLATTLQILKVSARIILLCGGNLPSDNLQFLQAAKDAGMMTPDYVYITPLYVQQTLATWEPWLNPNIGATKKAYYLSLYRNTLVIQTFGDSSELFKQFQDRIFRIVTADPDKYGVTNFTNDSLLMLSPLYDCISLYAMILNESVIVGKGTDINGTDMIAFSAYRDFTGITGRIVIDKTGDRISNYYAMKMDGNDIFSRYLLLGPNASDHSDNGITIFATYKFPIWNTVENMAPPAIPICGFNNELCPKYIISETALAIALPICLLIAAAVISMIVYTQKQKSFERQLLQLAWKVDLKQLQYISKQMIRASFISSTMNLRLDDGVTNASNGSSYGSVKSDGKFEGCGFYNGTMVALKRWKHNGPITLRRENLVHLKMLKDMNHENVNSFVGLSIDGESFVLCLWVYCSKHSLHEVLFNEDIHLDVNFQVSIMRDVIAGLDYIHLTLIAYHGRLFVSNCLVDSRWIVKLTDFGLQPIFIEMKKQRAIELEEEKHMHKLLCTAPELLRVKDIANFKTADVYQFGMIMYQVLFRNEPFADNNLSTAEIIHGLKLGTNSGIPLRPSVKNVNNLDAKIYQLMLSCWEENPLYRPTVQEVKKELFASTKSFGRNLVDHVMCMMENYATNLEKVVDERTVQLNEEHKRADRLLYQMLPKSVADALKNGQPVSPETYDCVTIYFSDIVGFTKICSKSQPVQVVAMLNGLYSRFDEIILSFDAYKVETIGDAYLVVSGLPVRNGDKHVTNIADMSMSILDSLKLFRISHLPEEVLLLRIGLHSGPVAGGVVGLTMPKFCLFGDSVNFASRMESTGEAGKIHISENTKLLLDQRPEYVTVERGQVDIKVLVHLFQSEIFLV